jgi:hypothetical protein
MSSVTTPPVPKPAPAPVFLPWGRSLSIAALPAVQFYRRTKDTRFCYGKFHANPQQYIPDLRAFVAPRTQRIWLIFSHLQQPSDRAEEQLIVHSLRPGWDVHCVVAPRNAELYMANRRMPSIR